MSKVKNLIKEHGLEEVVTACLSNLMSKGLLDRDVEVSKPKKASKPKKVTKKKRVVVAKKRRVRKK